MSSSTTKMYTKKPVTNWKSCPECRHPMGKQGKYHACYNCNVFWRLQTIEGLKPLVQAEQKKIVDNFNNTIQSLQDVKEEIIRSET